MKHSSNTYLQNGQTVAQIEKLRKQLATDPTTVLSACHFSDAHKEKINVLRELLEKQIADICEIYRNLEADVRMCVDQLPLPSGFFVDQKIKEVGVRSVSRFLNRSEGYVNALRTKTLQVSRLRERIRMEKHRFFLKERECELALEAAIEERLEEKTVVACKTELSAFREAGKQLTSLSDATGKLYSLLQYFCQITIVNFNVRVEKSVNFESGEEKCDLYPLRTVMGELLHVCERLQTELSQIDSQIKNGDT